MKRKGLGSSVFFLFTLFCIFSVAWAEVGVTDTEIKVATHMALTGPAAMVGKPISNGMQMYFNYQNAQGGVQGRKFVFIAEDDAFLPSRAKEAVKKLISKDQVFCILGPLQGAGIAAALPDIEKAKIPVLWLSSALDEVIRPARRYIFGWIIPYGDSTTIWVRYFANEMKVKRIAAIHQWGPVGDVNAKSFETETKKYGVELVHNEKLKNVKMDYSGLVSVMKAQKADCVFMTPTAQWVIPLLKEIERQGWDVMRVVGMAACNPPLLAQLAGSAAEGSYGTMLHVPTDYDDETMRTYNKILKEYGGGEMASSYNFQGYALAKMLFEALDKVGRDITREKLIDYLETWKDYETGWAGKFTYAPDDHSGQEGQILVKMVNGKGIVQGPRIYLQK